MNYYEWAARWGVNPAAIDELKRLVGVDAFPTANTGATTENGVQQRVRLEASKRGELLWRNNVGACVDDRGNHIRYGLCNESRQMNKRVKSSDLIGITPVVVTQQIVGMTVGVFTAVECKAPGWRYTGNEHESAQYKFGEIVLSHGGIFKFTN